jgi:hypothetical protein
MSKFFEALERAQMEQARRAEASSARTTGRPPPAATPSGEVSFAAPPVLGAPATATKGSVGRPDHVEEHLVSLCNPGRSRPSSTAFCDTSWRRCGRAATSGSLWR